MLTSAARPGIAMIAAAVTFLVAARAGAQQSCSTLPNPIIVAGSGDFEPMLTAFGAKLAAESPPSTLITAASTSLATSCGGIAGVIGSADLGDQVGRYHVQSGSSITTSTCVFAAGQTPHVAISDVFYETCATLPQPKPADVVDTVGPVQQIVFAVPKANTIVTYLTHKEVSALYGCGVSTARPVAGFFSDPTAVFCRDPSDAESQIIVARSIGMRESAMGPPNCSAFRNEATIASKLVVVPGTPPATMNDYDPPRTAIGFLGAVNYGRNRASLNGLAFQAPGQTRAYYADSRPALADSANVRDGHYPLWSYVHLIAKVSGGNLGPQASDLIGWINGTKTSPNVDFVAIEAKAWLIPQCAMKVQRSSDGGLLTPYAPSTTCNCQFEAVASRAIPASCLPCTSTSACPPGVACRQGFCE
jgi:hypothetical protein